MKKAFFILLVTAIAITAFSTSRFFEKEHSTFPKHQLNSMWLNAKPDGQILKSGDLIFRHGRGFISNALMEFGRKEKKYSHAGVISIEDGQVYVYHALGGEGNRLNRLRKDPLSVFCNPTDIHGFGIYRPALNSKQREQMISFASSYYAAGLKFDTDFDLTTDDKMYCTEFIYKVFKQISGLQNSLSLATLHKESYITCDDLYLGLNCNLIYSYNY